jgi:hypothetical protein
VARVRRKVESAGAVRDVARTPPGPLKRKMPAERFVRGPLIQVVAPPPKFPCVQDCRRNPTAFMVLRCHARFAMGPGR